MASDPPDRFGDARLHLLVRGHRFSGRPGRVDDAFRGVRREILHWPGFRVSVTHLGFFFSILKH